MKKIIAMLLVLVVAVALVACNNATQTPGTTAPTVETTTPTEAPTTGEEVTVMTFEEYMAAEIDAEVCVEFYVQGAQGWWFDDDAGHGKITVYGQDENGGYFGYDMTCAEEDASKLTAGTKIRVTGFKGEWSGEIEIIDGTFEIVEAEPYVAEALDVTELLGTEDLVKHQNMFVCFKGLTVKSVSYKNDEPGDDIYVTVTKDGADYDFCVERYLTGPDTDVYKAVGELAEGDVIDVEGFLYWYEGVNTHITAVSPAA